MEMKWENIHISGCWPSSEEKRKHLHESWMEMLLSIKRVHNKWGKLSHWIIWVRDLIKYGCNVFQTCVTESNAVTSKHVFCYFFFQSRFPCHYSEHGQCGLFSSAAEQGSMSLSMLWSLPGMKLLSAAKDLLQNKLHWPVLVRGINHLLQRFYDLCVVTVQLK